MVLDLLHDLIVILGRTAVFLDKVHHRGHLTVGDKAALDSSGLAAAQRSKEHVAPAHQFFCALSIEDDAGLHRGGHGEGDAAGDVGLHEAGNHVGRGALGSDDQVHPGGTAHLGHAADGFFHLFGRHQHQIGQLVDNHYNGGHFLHALGLGGQGVVLLQLTHAHLGEGAVALHHLSDRPLQGSGRLFGVGDHGNQQMRDAVVDTQLYHFRVHHDETDLFGAGFIKEGNN